MRIRYDNGEIEAILKDHLTKTFPEYVKGKNIIVEKYIGDISIDISDPPKVGELEDKEN
jgi:hypothetical protein